METITELRAMLLFGFILIAFLIILIPTKDEKKALESWKKRRKI